MKPKPRMSDRQRIEDSPLRWRLEPARARALFDGIARIVNRLSLQRPT